MEVRSRLLPLAVTVCLLAACDGGSSSGDNGGLRCDPDAVPNLLMSRYDDEDGDGRPLDEKFPEIDDEDDDIADHTWIRDHRGTYHLFFHNEGRGAPFFIEHYTTRNLKHLDYVGTALRAQPGAWDAGGMWAPHVIEVEGTYYMFYTGLESIAPGARQRIGLATSNDLRNWTRVPVNRCPGTTGDGCIYECRESWTTWGDDTDPYNNQCRDAFVMRDDEHDRWLMFATARDWATGYGVVTVAWSDDLLAWHGAGYINATRRLAGGLDPPDAQNTGGQAENPFVVSQDGRNYLFFTDWQDPEDSLDVAEPRTMVQYAVSPTLAVDSLASYGWIYAGYTHNPGMNATEFFRLPTGRWIISQSISNPNSGYNKPLRRMLILRCVDWGPGFTFTTTNIGFGDSNAESLLSPGGPASDRAP